MRRIGLFGGTFDPPHMGHFLMAQEALVSAGLDEIWFIPVATPPHKKREGLATGEERKAMLEAVLDQEERISVCEIELARAGTSYTIDTVKALTSAYPAEEFFFLIGGDMVDMLPDWYKIEELMELVTFIAFNRPGSGHAATSPYKHRLKYLDFIELNLSSTAIRERVKEGKPIRYFVPAQVEQLIKERGLYR